MMKKLTLAMLCLCVGTSVMAQSKKVTGTVTGDDGQPVIGASIVVKGTTVGTVTDLDGKFILEVPEDGKILQISYVGMNSQDVAVKSHVKVILQSDTQDLEEVVVTAQGLTRKQKSLGYATQQIKADDLSQARQTDLNNALVGKVSGVRFLGSSGATFDPGKIVLRGTSSLTEAGGNEPIYVIDGVISNNMALNMDDVASVNVLKGPAATALYGARGGNGAIIITTKGGEKGSYSEITVSHTIAWDKAYIPYDMQKEYGGGYMGADAEMPVFKYDSEIHAPYLAQMDGVSYYDYANDASWGPKLDGRTYAPWYAWDNTDPRFGQTAKWTPQMDLYDLFRTGLSNTTNVAFAKSEKDHASRISFSNVSRTGITPNSSASRRFLSARTSFKPIDRLRVSLDYKYTYRRNHNAAAEGYQSLGNALYSYQQFGHTNVNLKDLKENYIRPDGTFRSWNIVSPTNLNPQFHDNPYALFEQVSRDETYQWHVFSGDAELQIWKNLKAGIRVNGNLRNYKYELRLPQNILGQVSEYSQTQSQLSDIQTQGRVTWNDHFLNEKLSLDAALFFEDRQYDLDTVDAFTRDGIFMNGFFNTAASSGLPGGSSTVRKQHDRSVYGTATVGWDNTYYVDFSLRNDWTSTLHPDKNSFLYGGASVAAIASNWLKDSTPWLSFWKLRASMAQVGSTMSPYNVYPIYRVKSGSSLIKYGQLSNMWNDTNLRDPYIKPTISTSYEIGTEFRLFNDRFWGDFNFYNRDSKDQIINVNTTPASGYRSRKMNAGLIRNRGIELSLGGRIIDLKNWTWELNANVSRNRNTLEELAEGVDKYQIYWRSWSSRVYSYAEVGEPIGVIRGSTWKRDPQGRIILSDRGNANHPLGQYAPLLNTTAQEELGNIQPDLTGGFSTTLRFKDFHLGASFDFQVGGCIASATNMFGEGSGLLASTTGLNDKGNPIRSSVANGGGVRVDGVVQNADGTYTPTTAYVDANYYYQSRKSLVWEDYVYDASYLKMRELSIGYDVPSAFLQRMNCGVKKASVSFVAQNPWLIYSAVPNMDPSEMGGASYSFSEGGQAASARTFGFTVNLTF